MKIQAVNNYYANISYKSGNVQNHTAKPVPTTVTSPGKDSLKTAGIWLGFGLGFDYITKKCVIFKKSPVKNSLAVNGILALIAGGATFIKDSLKHKTAS